MSGDHLLPEPVSRQVAKAERGWRNLKGLASYISDPVCRESARRLADYRDRHEGERCVILGNGPSLNETDLSLIEDEVTFGLNRIYLAFDERDFRTTYLVSVNLHVLEQWGTEIAKLDMPTFLNWEGRDLVPERKDIIYLRTRPGPAFGANPVWQGVWEGATVTFVAMQLAYHMGFGEVILIGVDHSFETEGEAHKTVVSGGKDPNHFHPEYFGEGAKWQLPDLETSEIAYSVAKRAFEEDGRRIVDATIGGELDIFPKVDFEDYVTDG